VIIDYLSLKLNILNVFPLNLCLIKVRLVLFLTAFVFLWITYFNVGTSFGEVTVPGNMTGSFNPDGVGPGNMTGSFNPDGVGPGNMTGSFNPDGVGPGNMTGFSPSSDAMKSEVNEKKN
jgi:hypothetical protein